MAATGSAGTGTYKGLAQPLLGEYNQVQENIGAVPVTITGKSGQTADFLQCVNSSGTVLLYIDKNGAVYPTGGSMIKDNVTAPANGDMTINGQAWIGFSTSGRLYVRSNGTVYYFGALGTV